MRKTIQKEAAAILGDGVTIERLEKGEFYLLTGSWELDIEQIKDLDGRIREASKNKLHLSTISIEGKAFNLYIARTENKENK